MNKIIFPALFLTLLSGCASMAVTDDGIKANTAATLGVSQNELTITNRNDSGIQTTYLAQTADGKAYSCYMTGTVAITGRQTSDAICRPASGSATTPPPASNSSSSSCNDLLKAAGRC